MNSGYECKNCGNHLTDAHLVKQGQALSVVLRCRKCGSLEDVNVTSFGLELFEAPWVSEASMQENIVVSNGTIVGE